MGFNRMNNLGGWVAFSIAFFVYLVTMEPTVSLWDCGEFISSAFKLQVPHPPGAPLFVLVARFFIIMLGDDPAVAAKAVNGMSALASALTILFLFWTITWFARRIVQKQPGEPSRAQTFVILSAGITGALAYTFSDSFWFSAVEGEVYALSSFFTALVFWAILKWERRADTPLANRWLVFIFFMMGLSIGVHLLNLLAIPAIVMVYYFRKYKPTRKGTFFAFLAGCLITGFIQVFVIQYTVKGAGWMDIYFVNELGLPFFSGFTAFFVLLGLALFLVLRYAVRKKYSLLVTATWGVFFMLIGYSTYLTTMIRSNANTAVDMFNVDNPINLAGYLGREQYQDWPLLIGPDFTERAPYKVDHEQYVKGENKYEVAGQAISNQWAKAPNAHFFPRMWDNSNDRQQELCYRTFANMEEGESPTMGDNLKYFVNYQAGWMYLRYFMWNFAGRQNDVQGLGNARDSNWVSGISFVDNMMHGDQSKMPDSIHKDNKSYNRLFMLPLLLGIAGIFLQYKKNRRDLIVNGLLFFFTGLAIVVYLNQAGFQPRERDYAYVGSYYVFAIWIGLGVILVTNLFTQIMKQRYATATAALLCILLVPGWMVREEWDDHDRSGRTLARDMAKNYLESCPPNAILLTYEDNDTYPLWYAQEVEGIRPDVRVIVNTLVGSDWYMNQLRYKVNESDPYHLAFTKKQVQGDNREVMYFAEMPGFDKDKFYDLPSALKNILASDDPKYVTTSEEGIQYNITPVRKFVMPVDKEAALKSGVVKTGDPVASEIKIDLSKKTYLLRSDLLILSLIANGDWNRPICFTSMSGPIGLGLDKYVRQEGLTYRLVPVVNEEEDVPVNYDLAFQNMMHKFEFGSTGKKGIYYDEENRRRLNLIRLGYAQVALQFAAHGQKEKARQLLRRIDAACDERDYSYGATGRSNTHDIIAARFLYACYAAGDAQLANKVAASLKKDLEQQMTYYASLGKEGMNSDQLANNAYQQLQNGYGSLSPGQSAFANDILSSYQLLHQISEWEKKM